MLKCVSQYKSGVKETVAFEQTCRSAEIRVAFPLRIRGRHQNGPQSSTMWAYKTFEETPVRHGGAARQCGDDWGIRPGNRLIGPMRISTTAHVSNVLFRMRRHQHKP